MRLLIPLLLSLPALLFGVVTAQAEVFRYIDENGNVVYTDEQREGAEKIEVREVPTIEMPDGPLTTETLDRAKQTDTDSQGSGYQTVGFTEPQNESAFWSGGGTISIAVRAEPALRDQHAFEVLLDGNSLGRNSTGVYTVSPIDRGTHTATVRIVNSEDEIVETGESISFTVHRPSVLN